MYSSLVQGSMWLNQAGLWTFMSNKTNVIKAFSEKKIVLKNTILFKINTEEKL